MLFTSSTDVYLSLNGEVIPNHGYVEISDIGSSDTTALLCHTNRPASGETSTSGGDWFAPDGTRVGGLNSNDVPGFGRDRGPMVTRLKERSGTPNEGIYWCIISDATETSQTVYVGLYNTGEGIYVMLRTIILHRLHINSQLCIYKLVFHSHRSCLTVWWYDLYSAPPQYVSPRLYLHWWTCYHCHLDQRPSSC